MPITVLALEADTARARGAVYTLIAFGFQFPDRSSLEALADPARWTDWPERLHALDHGIGEYLEEVRAAIGEEANKLPVDSDCGPTELQQRHDDLFGHAVRGQCAAYEMEYGRHEIIRQASDLADVAGFYRAFGMEFAEGANGRPDHITAECEFMSVLCAKEAHALGLNDEGRVDICVGAERAFLRDHLARWLPAFAHRVQEADSTGVYAGLARLATAFVSGECERFEVQAGPQTLQLRPADPVQDREVSCGPADCGDRAGGEQLVQLNTDIERHLEQ